MECHCEWRSTSYIYHLPLQEVELWEASQHGLIERVRDLLHTVHVNIDSSNIVSVSPISTTKDPLSLE